MTDISIIGTGCLIVALVVAAGIVIWQRREIGRLFRAYSVAADFIEKLDDENDKLLDEVLDFRTAAAKTHAQRIAAAKKGRATQTARALAKKAGLCACCRYSPAAMMAGPSPSMPWHTRRC